MKCLFCFIGLFMSLFTYAQHYHQVEARANSTIKEWKSYTAKTVDKIPGFKMKKEPQQNEYGSWMVNKRKATGFFRIEKIGTRWWFIDPDGYPFIHKAVVAFSPGGSIKQKSAFNEKFGTREKWVDDEIKMLKSYGFNGVAAWSDTKTLQSAKPPLVYTVYVNPMNKYKSVHRNKYGGKYLYHGWQGYRFDLPMIFDPEFDSFVEEELKKVTQYKDDKYLLGYFTDNEMPWVNDALDKHLLLLAKDEPGYIAAKNWLQQRKGGSCDLEYITDGDRKAFLAFMLETYLQKITAALRKYDPNHLYLGCRFNQESEELQNKEMFKIAGKYMDVISINHYRKWEPVEYIMNQWAEWSGKPFIITEWYTKGEDTDLPNKTGAGWNVPTQRDRGYFYQNFCIELIKNGNCIGWHWFRYQDNDPHDLTTDESNRDSNKGIIDSNYTPYYDMLEQMKMLNQNTYNLIQWFDSKK